MEDSTLAYEENKTKQQEVLDGMAEYTTAADENTKGTKSLAGEITSVKKQMDELAEAYKKVYDEAYESINGQFGLFESVSVEVDLSVSDMISSLEAQAKYMSNYSANLKKAAAMGLSEGLIAELSDGSVESAAYLQAIVDGGKKKISQLNDEFAKVEEGKESFANTVADLQTEFSTEMGKLQKELEDTVAEMDLNTEAAESGKNTVLGFIDGAEDMLPQVKAAYEKIAKAAVDAINEELDINSPSEVFALAGRMSGAGYIKGAESMEEDTRRAMADYASMAATAFADEARVIALSPLLLEMMSARSGAGLSVETSAGSEIPPIILYVDYHIESGTPVELEAQLKRHDADLATLIRSVIEEMSLDSRRKAMV